MVVAEEWREGYMDSPIIVDGETDGKLTESKADSDSAATTGPAFPIVGVGASAGGLEALEAFFEQVPEDSEMAFVVIQHLSPDFKSVMDQLLSRRTTLKVHRVEDGMEVQPGAVYLIPPKKEMIISGGRLLLSDKDPNSGLTLPIDTFFRSLAQECGERAIAIVLSGTGSDGSRGIREVHEAGGLVLVQSLDTARFDGMPKSAIDTGIVDLQIAPADMPAALQRYVGRGFASASLRDETPLGLASILGLLRREYGIDFSHYKSNTLHRRLERRAKISHSSSIEDYARMLAEEPSELHLLYKDLLIGVTRFFRDAEAFQALQTRIVPELIALRNNGDELRVWSAACATGEEAYSLAILLHEATESSRRGLDFRIFATDVHQSLLETAAAGHFSASALEGMDPARIERYFLPTNDGYRVIRELRERIVFAPHNLLKDAPFTKLDLVTCRNILIYLQPAAQKKVLSLFHFGLKPRGLLFLGLSETPGELSDEFETLDHRHKIYRKSRDVRLPTETPLLGNLSFGTRRTVTTSRGRETVENQLFDSARNTLVAEFAPPSLLVDQDARLIHSFGGGGKYLSLADGRSSLCILDLVPGDLKVVLNGALQRALKEGKRVEYGGVPFESSTGPTELRISVLPVPAPKQEGRRFLIAFQPRPIIPEETLPDRVDMHDQSRQRIRRLEEELQSTRENLQATLEEMETSNEELQATNEELVASNEELQSTNEELQSVNEELYTVNSEYQRKIAELTQLNSDMDNLFASTEVGVIFVDRELRIRKFTPRSADTFQLNPNDVGRRLDTFAHTLDDCDLLKDLETVRDTGKPIEREVCDRKGVWYLMRILPYRGPSGADDGVVFSLIDVSLLKAAEKRLRLMSRVFQDSADPVIIENLGGIIIDVNEEAASAYGYTKDELLGHPTTLLIPERIRAHSAELRKRCLLSERLRSVESVRITKEGQTVPVLLTLSLITDDAHQPIGIASIAKDISALKQAEQEAQEALRRRDEFLAMLSHELRNPLAGIRNAVQVMLHEKTEPDHVDAAISAVDRQASHMARLLNDLLDVTRVTRGKIDFQSEVVDLRTLVRDGVQAVKQAIDEKRQSLNVDLPQEPVWVHGDPSRLLQVVENLLTNASKYTPENGRIDIQITTHFDKCKLSVKDNGRGIEPTMLSKIFDLFVQADRTLDRRDGGMGVGLTLVRTLVELHGGTIQAFSDGRDKGSEFVLEMPLTSAPTESSQRPSPPRRIAPSLRVVIVEDDDDSRAMLEKLLQLEGFDVHSAADGESGLHLIRKLMPDVALVDVGLPKLDGYGLARRLRDEPGHDGIRLIALTGYGREQDREAAKDAGFDEHLVKPLEPTTLFATLASTSDNAG